MSILLTPFLHGQNLHLSMSVGYTKYKYEYKSIFDYRSTSGTPTPCLLEIQRSQFTRWVSPEIQVLGHYNILDFIELSSGLRYHVKGKDITVQSDLSCLHEFPIIQIRSTYIGIPFYIQSDPKEKIGLKAGIIYGIKLWDRELHNDSKFTQLTDPRFKKLFSNSKELSLDFRFSMSSHMHFFFGGIFGLDRLNDQLTQASVRYNGIRASVNYNFIK